MADGERDTVDESARPMAGPNPAAEQRERIRAALRDAAIAIGAPADVDPRVERPRSHAGRDDA